MRRGRPRVLVRPSADALACRVLAGWGVTTLARAYGVSNTTMRRWLEDAGLLRAAVEAGRARGRQGRFPRAVRVPAEAPAAAPEPPEPSPRLPVLYGELVEATASEVWDVRGRPVAVQQILEIRRGGAGTGRRLLLRVWTSREQALALAQALRAAVPPLRRSTREASP